MERTGPRGSRLEKQKGANEGQEACIAPKLFVGFLGWLAFEGHVGAVRAMRGGHQTLRPPVVAYEGT